LKLCRVSEAWNIPTPNGPQGKGSIVAHPDTGYTRHPELIRSDILFAKGYDFVADTPDALDPLDPPNAGHGTSTGSVIVSDVGPAGAIHVTGVAPQASLIPLRVSSSVVHFSWTRLCAALYRAIDDDAHVVSMSLGGPWGGFALHDAVRDAVDAGLMLVAAAGNGWPFVVYPARYDEVIAVAACNVDKQRWADSASGEAVDITAPGESVWRARTQSDGTFDVDRSSGTSYAAAHVAGIGALWLAHHGRANLVTKYGSARIASVFKEMLTTADDCAGRRHRQRAIAARGGAPCHRPRRRHGGARRRQDAGRKRFRSDRVVFPARRPVARPRLAARNVRREGTRARHQARLVRRRDRIPSRRRSQRLRRDACRAGGASRRGCASAGQASAASLPQPEATAGVIEYLRSGV
jgi:hypothetical protein